MQLGTYRLLQAIIFILAALGLYLGQLFIFWENDIWYRVYLFLILILIALAGFMFVLYLQSWRRIIRVKLEEAEKKCPIKVAREEGERDAAEAAAIEQEARIKEMLNREDEAVSATLETTTVKSTPESSDSSINEEESPKTTPQPSSRSSSRAVTPTKNNVFTYKSPLQSLPYSSDTIQIFNGRLLINPTKVIKGKNNRCLYNALALAILNDQSRWEEIKNVILDKENVRALWETDPSVVSNQILGRDVNDFEEFYKRYVNEFQDGKMGDFMATSIIANHYGKTIFLRGFGYNGYFTSDRMGYLPKTVPTDISYDEAISLIQDPDTVKLFLKSNHFELFRYKTDSNGEWEY